MKICGGVFYIVSAQMSSVLNKGKENKQPFLKCSPHTLTKS